MHYDSDYVARSCWLECTADSSLSFVEVGQNWVI